MKPVTSARWLCPAPAQKSLDPWHRGPCHAPLPCAVHNVPDAPTGALIYGASYLQGYR